MTFPPNEVSAVVREQTNQRAEGQRAAYEAGDGVVVAASGGADAGVVPEFYGTGAIGHDRVIGVCGARGTVVLRSFRADPDDDFGEEDDGESMISIDPGSLDALLAFVQGAIVARNAKRRLMRDEESRVSAARAPEGAAGRVPSTEERPAGGLSGGVGEAPPPPATGDQPFGLGAGGR